jgi:hypothetical protein
MKPNRADDRVVWLRAFYLGDQLVIDWGVDSQNIAGVKPGKSLHRRFWLKTQERADVPALTFLLMRAAKLCVAGRHVKPDRVRVTQWRETGPWIDSVPPSGGEGGEKPPPFNTDRSADTAQPEPPLPSSMRPRGAGGGGERSDLLSVVDVDPYGPLPGQLPLPLDEA